MKPHILKARGDHWLAGNWLITGFDGAFATAGDAVDHVYRLPVPILANFLDIPQAHYLCRDEGCPQHGTAHVHPVPDPIYTPAQGLNRGN